MAIMKNRKYIYGIAACMTLLIGGLLQAKLKTLQGEDTDAMQLKSITVEGFEKEVWTVEAHPPAPQSTVEAKLIPDGTSDTKRCVPKNLAFDKDKKKCLGLRFNFVFPGENYVSLVPTTEILKPTGQLNDKNEPVIDKSTGIKLPGKVKAISIWVLGRGNEYNLEGWVEDWKGDTHIYDFGSLDFIGWRPLTVEIPVSVPQDVDSFPQTKSLVFKRFVIRTASNASKEKVVLFFDELKILSDVFDLFFDGAEIDFDKQDRIEKDEMKTQQEKIRKYSKGSGGSGK